VLSEIQGIHNITSIAGEPKINNGFCINVLAFRRMKKTVNFDKPSIYHLYYADPTEAPGKILKYFPFLLRKRGRRSNGEVNAVNFFVNLGSLQLWFDRLKSSRVQQLKVV